jgi:hypothetical protein
METIHDVLRSLIHVFGAGEKYDQALAVINKDDPDIENPDPNAPPELTPAEKAAEYDRLKAAEPAPPAPAADSSGGNA